MTDVLIAGIGQVPVGEHWHLSLRQLAYRAYKAALADAGGLKPDALYVGNMVAAVLSHQAHLGSLIADHVGLRGIEAATIEAGNASGGAALRMAYLAIASGQVDVALVLGVEKFTDQVGASVEAAASIILDSDYEAVQGLTPTGAAALVMQRYLHETGAPRAAFAGFAIHAHDHAASNPHAMFRNRIRPEAYEQAGAVCAPLNMFDVAPWADGAAALILARRDRVPEGFAHPLVRVSGSSLVTDRLALHDRINPLDFSAARKSVERACCKAGILPQDVNLFELCDSASVYAALSLEAAGFAQPGEGWRLAQDGTLGLQGSLPVNTFGGWKARGNPGGATGVYQAVEATLQLRAQAGPNQVLSPRRAMIQALSGAAATAVTHIFERLDGA
ncbi:MAG: thiolase C-terminal domain-containing protein [Chloroflexota bacterium]